MLYSPVMRYLCRCLLLAGLLATLGILAAACGDDDGSATTTPAVTPSATPSVGPTSAPGPTTAAATPAPFGTRGPVEAEAQDLPGAALLVDVRTGRQEDGFDRIVFEFEGGLPGYLVEYVEPPVLGAFSGEPVDIDGQAFLQIRLRPAAGYDPETGDPVYTGSQDLKPGLPAILEAEVTGDFEATMTWAVGLTAEADFRVTTLEDPYRIVIDVDHP